MKRYIVFLKQVPLSTKVAIDPVTKTLKRSSALSQTNPDDLYALQAALNLKKKTNAEIVAISMGPSSAMNVLHEALQLGADRAILLSSPAFAGSDTWCTSLILSEAVRKIGDYDMLFFGKMAIDGDTAQVGPEVAGHLNIPQATSFTGFESIEPSAVYLYKQIDNIRQTLRIELPCAIMAGKDSVGQLDSPTLEGWRRSMRQEITVWNENDLQLETNRIGLMASPTRVVSTYIPEYAKKISWLNNADEFAVAINNFIQH